MAANAIVTSSGGVPVASGPLVATVDNVSGATVLPGAFKVPTATVKAAVNASSGTCALDTSGTVTVTTTAVTATSLIFVMRTLDGGTVGGLYTAKTADIVAGTSFIIRSFVSSTAGAATAATSDTSTVAWFIIN